MGSESDGLDTIQQLGDSNEVFESPIDISIRNTRPLRLPPLVWTHYDLPCKMMKITNTSHTALVSAKWLQERPFLEGGPLRGRYVFSQLHFHWGDADADGSEHSVDGTRFPLEMHLVHFNAAYGTQHEALRHNDGLCSVVAFFQIEKQDNPSLQTVVDLVRDVVDPHTSTPMAPDSLTSFIEPFARDYYSYWGSVMASGESRRILWIFCRHLHGVSSKQLARFREMRGEDGDPLVKNNRDLVSGGNCQVFHCNPEYTQATMYPASHGGPVSEAVSSNKAATFAAAPPSSKHRGDAGAFDSVVKEDEFDSPIDLSSRDAAQVRFPPLNYNRLSDCDDAIVTNTGSTVEFSVSQPPTISGGPLGGEYVFAQCHFHWGANDGSGSEHTIDGRRFAMEVHSVFYLKECGSLERALSTKNGLACIAFLLQKGDRPNEDFQKVVDQIKSAQEPNRQCKASFPIFDFVDNAVEGSRSYYAYPGTLSDLEKHPVTWIVLSEPITVSSSQIDAFRKVKNSDEQNIQDNARDVQPLKGRPVYQSPLC